MKGKAKLFEIVLAVCGLFMIMIVVHELTHAVLSTKVAGICFGNCSLGDGTSSPAAVYYNPGAIVWRDEVLPSLMGFGSFFLLLWLYAFFLYKGKL